MAKTHDQIDRLWREMQSTILSAYTHAQASGDDDGQHLRDYVENQSWHDALASLLGRECANERQHRSNRSVKGFSVTDAAKLILMGNFLTGSHLHDAPSSIRSLAIRQTAFEMEVVGFLAREFVAEEWRQAVNALDYAKLMQAA